MNHNNALVAIHCLVYNHEPYLRDCLEGFVMQQTNFPFVAIVHDDASTDGSAAIIREYEEKYPNIIKPIYETENQYSKHDGSLGRIMNAAIDATGAKYVAMCEGDDYWTDPLKLQKQVDFLEANEEYGTCCHRFFELTIDGVLIKDHWTSIILDGSAGTELNKENYLTIGKLPQILTTLYRIHCLKQTKYEQIESRSRYDQSLFYALVQEAPIWIMNENMGVYRRHNGGVATSIQGSIIASKKHYHTWKDVYHVYRTKETKAMYINNLKSYIYRYVKTNEKIELNELKSLLGEYHIVTKSIISMLHIYTKLMRAYTIRIIKQIG